MSDPRVPFTAGERLAPTRRDPPRPPPRHPRPPNGARGGKPPRKRGLLALLAGFLVSGAVQAVFVGIVGAAHRRRQRFSSSAPACPSVDSLKDYKPPLESRVYASNFQLVSELGDEHSIYVPYNQIPPVVARPSSRRKTGSSGSSPASTRSPSCAPAYGYHPHRLRSPPARRLHHHPAGGEEHAAG